MKHLQVTVLAVCTSLLVATAQATQSQHKSKPSALPVVGPADPEPSSKTILYGEQDVVKLKTKVRFTSMIVLPEGEKILDFVCGDRDMWIVNGSNQNIALVKPAKEGSMTNLNLITASGNIYTFILVEVSNLPNTEPDLKVFIEPKEQSMISAATQAPRFVPADELESYRQQLEIAKQETLRIQKEAEAANDGLIGKFLSETRFTYHFDPKKKPFHVSAIYHDKTRTYIKAEPEEVPTLWEVRDGMPALVNFQYKDGVYIADKVIDRGYLAIGKSRLLFVRKEAQ